MSKKLIFLMTILVMGGVSFGVGAYTGFNSGEDGGSYTTGNINTQGSDIGDWAGPWTATINGTQPAFQFDVAATGSQGISVAGDQHLAMVGSTSGAHVLDRVMDAWAGDFVLSFDAKISKAPTATHQLQFGTTTSGSIGLRPLNIKWELGTGGFKVNDTVLLSSYLAPTESYLGMDDGQWVSVMIVCDWETATFDLYWEKTDGTMSYVGQKVGWKDGGFDGSTMTVVRTQMSAPKLADFWLDNLVLKAPDRKVWNPLPDNGAQTSVLPDLSWHIPLPASANTWTYKVYLDTDSDFTGIVPIDEPNSVDRGSVSGTEIGGPLTAGAVYYWRVDAIEPNELAEGGYTTYTGDVWTFKAGITPPSLVSPPDAYNPGLEIDDPNMLQWTSAEDSLIATHDIIITPDGETPIPFENKTSPFPLYDYTQAHPEEGLTLQWGKQYIWQVLEKDSGGNTISEGPIWKFRIRDLRCDGAVTRADIDGSYDCAVTIADLAAMAENWLQ